MKRAPARATIAALFTLCAVVAAHAEIVISKKPTQNMNCNAGVCTPTAQNAVLNVGDLTNMLAAGNATVQTGNGDGTAAAIAIADGFSWTNTTRLTLSAKKSITVKAPVTVAGPGALTISYNIGHTNGDLYFQRNGRITFRRLSSNLVIQGVTFALVNDVPHLAQIMTSNPSGFLALANNYDAAIDGTYKTALADHFSGILEGLGHALQNVSVSGGSSGSSFIRTLDSGAVVRNLAFENADIEVLPRHQQPAGLILYNHGALENVSLSGNVSGEYHVGAVAATNESDGAIRNATVSATVYSGGDAGGITGYNQGTIVRATASGSVSGSLMTACFAPYTGGLVGQNLGSITLSRSSASVNGGHGEYKQEGCEVYARAGGLAGVNDGLIDRSFATGNVTAGEYSYAGGLVGYIHGTVSNAYSAGAAHTDTFKTRVGGLSGYNVGPIATSYSIGAPTGGDPNNDCPAGGLIGCDGAPAGSITSSYWDFDTSGISDPSRGAGDPPNDPGITGLTTAQFQSGLPAGFDPAIWGSNPKINNGYPYLRANPPPK